MSLLLSCPFLLTIGNRNKLQATYISLEMQKEMDPMSTSIPRFSNQSLSPSSIVPPEITPGLRTKKNVGLAVDRFPEWPSLPTVGELLIIST